MKTLGRAGVAGLLLLAYPAAWRERYGNELLTLLEDEPLTARAALDVVAAGLRQRGHVARRALTGGVVMTLGPAWRHPTLFALVAAILLLPTFVFVGGSLLAYELGMDAVRGVIEPVLAGIAQVRVLDLALVVAPAVAFVAALAPLLRLGVERRDGALEAVVAVRARTLNLLVGAVALALAGVLVWHVVVESVLQVGA